MLLILAEMLNRKQTHLLKIYIKKSSQLYNFLHQFR